DGSPCCCLETEAPAMGRTVTAEIVRKRDPPSDANLRPATAAAIMGAHLPRPAERSIVQHRRLTEKAHGEGNRMKLSQLFSNTRTPRSAPAMQTVESPGATDEHGVRPTDSALDLFGITHPGKVRAENQDPFFVGTVNPQVTVHGTSLAAVQRLTLRGQRLATVLLVADGVGGQAAGSEASRLAAEAVTAYVSSTLPCYHAAGDKGEKLFLDALRAAAVSAHETVSVESVVRGDIRM